jgi:hypothetical protein
MAAAMRSSIAEKLGRPPTAIAELREVVEASSEHVEHHSRQILGVEKFVDMLTNLVGKQAPDLAPTLATITAPFQQALIHERAYLGAEERLRDDLDDLAARFMVVHRVSQEVTDAQQKVKDGRHKIESLRRDLDIDQAKGGQKKYQLEAAIKVAIDAKARAVEAAQLKLEEYIQVRQSYNAFKLRRLRHGYTNLGEVTRTALRGEGKAYEAVLAAIGEARNNLEAALSGEVPIVEEGEETEQAGEETPRKLAAGGEEEMVEAETRQAYYYEPPPQVAEPPADEQDATYGDSPFPE